MPHVNHWVDISCDYCRWHTDTLTTKELSHLWTQYRKHKRDEHPETCERCKFYAMRNFEDDDDKFHPAWKMACDKYGCTIGRKSKKAISEELDWPIRWLEP